MKLYTNALCTQKHWCPLGTIQICSVHSNCSALQGAQQQTLKGEVKSFFLFHHWVRIRQTKTSFNRQFSPKRPEVGQIFILRSNFDQNKDHMTSKQVRGPSKNWHPASEGTLKTDIQQVRGPSSNNRVFFLLKHPYVTLEPLLGKGYKITGCFFFFKLSNWPLNKISESNCKIQGI